MAFNVLVTEASTVLRWTAEAGSARSATLVLARLCSLRRLRLVGPAVFVFLTVLFAQRIDHAYSAGTRWTWGALYAAGYTLVLVVASVLITYVQTRRSLAPRFRPGTELTADWGDDSVVLGQPLAQTRLPFTSIGRVRRYGEWTAFQVPGNSGWSVWPTALLPEQEVVRLTA
jgi:hypothetical protein